jgi:hypothetical protein
VETIGIVVPKPKRVEGWIDETNGGPAIGQGLFIDYGNEGRP